MDRMVRRDIDEYIDKQFGRLTIKAYKVINSRGHFICLCECGTKKTIRRDSIVDGKTKSCGCLSVDTTIKTHRTHGMSDSRIYKIFHKMHSRCYNPKNERYNRYGGRGINVCEEWLHDFPSFLEWALSNGYDDSLSINRINNDGDYSPENCEWADNHTQMNNTSRNIHVQFRGEIKTLGEWSRELGIGYDVLRGYYRRNNQSLNGIHVKKEADN